MRACVCGGERTYYGFEEERDKNISCIHDALLLLLCSTIQHAENKSIQMEKIIKYILVPE